MAGAAAHRLSICRRRVADRSDVLDIRQSPVHLLLLSGADEPLGSLRPLLLRIFPLQFRSGEPGAVGRGAGFLRGAVLHWRRGAAGAVVAAPSGAFRGPLRCLRAGDPDTGFDVSATAAPSSSSG